MKQHLYRLVHNSHIQMSQRSRCSSQSGTKKKRRNWCLPGGSEQTEGKWETRRNGWPEDSQSWMEVKVDGQKPGRSAGTRRLTNKMSRTDTRSEQKGKLAGSLLYSSCCSRNQSRLEGESKWMHENRGGKVYGSRNNTKSLINNTRHLQRCKNMERCY